MQEKITAADKALAVAIVQAVDHLNAAIAASPRRPAAIVIDNSQGYPRVALVP